MLSPGVQQKKKNVRTGACFLRVLFIPTVQQTKPSLKGLFRDHQNHHLLTPPLLYQYMWRRSAGVFSVSFHKHLKPKVYQNILIIHYRFDFFTIGYKKDVFFNRPRSKRGRRKREASLQREQTPDIVTLLFPKFVFLDQTLNFLSS